MVRNAPRGVVRLALEPVPPAPLRGVFRFAQEWLPPSAPAPMTRDAPRRAAPFAQRAPPAQRTERLRCLKQPFRPARARVSPDAGP
jgi:hypothetical protein